MMHCVSARKKAIRPTKESKRKYLNLKSNENLSAAEFSFHAIRPNELDRDDFFRYPVYDEAYVALRAHLQVPHVLLTSGCHDAIRVIAASLDPDKNRVLLCAPNYDGYRHYFEIHAIPVLRRDREPSRRHDLAAILELATDRNCNIVVLTNPDPFVGDYFSRSEIQDFVGACEARGISVILDEVYAGFGRESDVRLTVQYGNLLVLNSLSKSYGMPGARVGWVAGAGEAIDELGREFPESSISGFSLSILLRLLCDGGWIEQYRAAVVRNREEMARVLGGVPSIQLYAASATNFLLFRAFDCHARGEFRSDMLREGIYLADLNAIPGFEDHYRVTVCAQEQREKLIHGFEQARRQENPGHRAAL